MHVEGIVVKKLPLREHDQLVVLYTRECGKLAAVAKSSLKRTSRQAPALDEGTLLQCELVAGRAQTHLMTGAQCVRSWAAAKETALAWAVAQYFLEAADALMYDGQPDERLWSVLVGVLERLDSGHGPHDVLQAGQADLLEALGYGKAAEPHNRLHALFPRQPASLTLIAHLAEGHIS